MTISSDGLFLPHTTLGTPTSKTSLCDYFSFFPYFKSNNIFLSEFISKEGDPNLARSFYHGIYVLNDILVDTKGHSPFVVKNADGLWQKDLHCFQWLDHLYASGTHIGLALSRNLILDWIDFNTSQTFSSKISWNVETAINRTLSWIYHSSWLFQKSNAVFQTAFVNSLRLHIIYLYRHLIYQDSPDLFLKSCITLKFATRILDCSNSFLAQIDRLFSQALKTHIFPDGGHSSRKPSEIYVLLSFLLPLRQSYINEQRLPPSYLIEAIERLIPGLRFFLHSNGEIANFNESYQIPKNKIDRLLELDDTRADLLEHAPYSGYYRLKAKNTILIADVGSFSKKSCFAPAQLNLLSFEFSSFDQTFVINAGRAKPQLNASPESEQNLSSTVQICEQTPRYFKKFFFLKTFLKTSFNPPILCPIKMEDTIGFKAGHNLYQKSYGFSHIRKITLSKDGACIKGCDRFIQSSKKRFFSKSNQVAIRFYIHPNVDISSHPNGVMLQGSENNLWFFSCTNFSASILDAFDLSVSEQFVPAKQIVLSFSVKETLEVFWQFLKIPLKMRST